MLRDKIRITCKILTSTNQKKITNLVRNVYSVCFEPTKCANKPLIVQIEPTTFCNLKCVMCVSPDLTRERQHLSLTQFEKLLEKLNYLEKINLVGVGETLLNPELPGIIRVANKKGIKIGIATNGILLNKDKAKELLDAGIDWLNISIDGANAESYKKIRGNDEFHTILKNARNFQMLLEGYSSVDSAIWFTIQRGNLYELPAMIDLVQSIGYKRLFSQKTHLWGDPAIQLKKEYLLNVDKTVLLKLIAETEELAKSKGVIYTSYNVSSDKRSRSCKWPWRSCYVSVEGFVTPCCLNGCNPQIINFGNIFDNEFEDIWNSSEYKKFRHELKSPNCPEVCKSCPGY